MPDGLITFLTLILVLAVLMVGWTLVQAHLNYRAVRPDPKLKRFARNTYLRVLTLFLATTAIALVGVLYIIYHPRPDWVRSLSSLLFIVLAVALAGTAYHEYRGMLDQIQREDDDAKSTPQ